MIFKGKCSWTSLAVQWLRLCTSSAGSTGSVPGWGTKIPHAAGRVQKEKKKKKKKAIVLKFRETDPLQSDESYRPFLEKLICIQNFAYNIMGSTDYLKPIYMGSGATG